MNMEMVYRRKRRTTKVLWVEMPYTHMNCKPAPPSRHPSAGGDRVDALFIPLHGRGG
jgi:hypothetical protein